MARTKQKARKRVGGSVNGKRKRDDDSPQPAKRRDLKDIPVIPGRPEQTLLDEAVAKEKPADLAGRFTKSIKQHEGDLSTIELEDRSLPAKAFRDTSDFAEARLVKNLPQFLEQYIEGGAETLKTCNGTSSPHTLIITSSAIRAQDVLREVRKYGTEDSKIAKLFAKHMKLEEMVQYVQKTRFGIGAGTSARIQRLIEEDALKVDSLKRIVLDSSYLDEKKRTIFSDRDAFVQLLNLVNLETLKLRFINDGTEVMVF